MSETWKVTLACTRAEAEALTDDGDVLAHLADPPVLMTSERVEDDPDSWQIDAFFSARPPRNVIAALRALAPSHAREKPTVEMLPDEDWVTLSQQGLDPISVGRFHVRNRAEDPVPAGARSFLIPAGRAFGTGQHETTSGCLAMLDRLARAGMRFRNVADIGTGTGLLAFAGLSLWPRARVTASDIDPASVEVTGQNTVLNGFATGRGAGRVALYEAAGVSHPGIVARGPYDLLIANILAGPLIELAPSLCAQVADGGSILLAGLLDSQERDVRAAYRRQGMRIAGRLVNGQWPTLWLRKRPQAGHVRPRRWRADATGDAPGFGSW